MQHGFTMATQSIGTTARILSGSWRCQASDRDCYTGAGVFLHGTWRHPFVALGRAPPLAVSCKQLRSSTRVLAVTAHGAPRKQYSACQCCASLITTGLFICPSSPQSMSCIWPTCVADERRCSHSILLRARFSKQNPRSRRNQILV